MSVLVPPVASAPRVPFRELIPLALVFLASRAAYALTGARFDASELDRFWHFAPLHLLRTRLFETVFYLHFQPPLYNLYLGATVKLFGTHATTAFAVASGAVGFACYVVLYGLMRTLGAARAVAFAFSSAYIVFPAALLFESYLFYTSFVAALLVFSAAALHRAVTMGTALRWGAFFALLSVVILVRALFHPACLVLVALALGWALPQQRRAIGRGVAIPLLLVFAVCVKNAVVFGFFGTSSWTGFALARMTVRNLPDATRRQWIAEGALSPLSSVRPPGSLDEYAKFVPLPPKTGIAVLDEPRKPKGDLNLHHLAYVGISKALGRDALVVMRRAPGVYISAAGRACRRFLEPSSGWHPLERNLRHIRRYDAVHRALFHFPGFGRSGIYLLLLPFALIWGARAAARRAVDRAAALTLGFMVATIAYVTLTGCLLEPQENMRFRFMIEAFLWVVVALGVTSGLTFVKRTA